MNSVSGLYLHPLRYFIKTNLSFDVCRWQVEAEDVEAVDGAITECHRPLTNRLSSKRLVQRLP